MAELTTIAISAAPETRMIHVVIFEDTYALFRFTNDIPRPIATLLCSNVLFYTWANTEKRLDFTCKHQQMIRMPLLIVQSWNPAGRAGRC